MKNFFHNVLSFLRVRVAIDGLEVSDEVLRLIHVDKTGWHMAAVRLAPGVMEKGKIKDAQAFTAALRELRSKIPSIKKNKKVNVAVALSSVNMYSQVFTLPFMAGADLEKAIGLNVQMISPVDVSRAYYGWQLLGRDETQLRSEVAAAFADKTIVDEMAQALYTAGFVTVGVESRALAIVRALREKGTAVDMEKSYILLEIDNSGIDFLVIRKGKLYFEYQNAWGDVADQKGQVSVDAFAAMLASSMRQVMNFYSQHWPEPLSGVILSAAAFKDEAERAIQDVALLPIIPLALMTEQPIAPEWYAAFGCGLRGLRVGPKDEEINLSGSGAMDLFYEERLLDFMSLWRVLVPVVLSCLIIVFVLVNYFLETTKASIGSEAAAAQSDGGVSADIAALDASSTAFNQLVSLAADAESQLNKNYLMITDINAAAVANGVTVTNISFQAANAPILVAGTASEETQIPAFQNAIQADPHFGTVTLPLLNIQQNGAGAYTFSMSFPLTSGF
jgi:hypothetical protein